MRFNRLMPALLLTALLTLTATAQESPDTSGSSTTPLIEPSRTYSGVLVLEMLDAVRAAAEAEIEAAYEDGYKQGLLEVAPSNAALESLNRDLAAETEKLSRNRVRDTILAGAGGLLVGAAAGILVMAVN